MEGQERKLQEDRAATKKEICGQRTEEQTNWLVEGQGKAGLSLGVDHTPYHVLAKNNTTNASRRD